MTDMPHPLPSLNEADIFGAAAGGPDDLTSRLPVDLDRLHDVPVKVSAILGRTRIPVGDLLKIGPGSLLELDRRVGEAVDIRVNDRLVARGDVVLIDNCLGVTLTEIVLPSS